jgi:hypothetical protein
MDRQPTARELRDRIAHYQGIRRMTLDNSVLEALAHLIAEAEETLQQSRAITPHGATTSVRRSSSISVYDAPPRWLGQLAREPQRLGSRGPSRAMRRPCWNAAAPWHWVPWRSRVPLKRCRQASPTVKAPRPQARHPRLATVLCSQLIPISFRSLEPRENPHQLTAEQDDTAGAETARERPKRRSANLTGNCARNAHARNTHRDCDAHEHSERDDRISTQPRSRWDYARPSYCCQSGMPGC